MSRSKKILIAFAAVFLVAILAMGGYILLFYRFVKVPTGSMANTIIPGDRVMCDMRVGNVGRGDIVVFKFPSDPKVQYMSRVVGLPDEKILIQGVKVYINGQELPESRTFVDLSTQPGEMREGATEGEGRYRVFYYENRDRTSGDEAEFLGMQFAVREPFQIPRGHYFVMGDSRDNSHDSRFWGTVPREMILGKAMMIFNSDAPGGEERVFKKLR